MGRSIKETAGLTDTLKIYEGIHLAEDFIRNTAINPEDIEPELKEEGERHFSICEKCRNRKGGFLPLREEDI